MKEVLIFSMPFIAMFITIYLADKVVQKLISRYKKNNKSTEVRWWN